MAPSHSTAADTPASWFTQALLSASRMRALAVAVALLLVLALQASLAPTLNAWNDRLTSRSWSWADSTNQERRIVVIDIDEKSVQALGTWPWRFKFSCKPSSYIEWGCSRLKS